MKLLLFMIVLAILAGVSCLESRSGAKGASGGSGSNGGSGTDFESTTTPSTTLSTTVPTTSESTSPVPTTTISLKCGALADTPCCTPEITQCLDKEYAGWLKYTSTDGYEQELGKCGCFLTTASMTTKTETPTTSLNSNCSWLKTPFNYTVGSYPPTDFSYYGTCCSEKSIDTLNDNSLNWLLTNENADSWSKWSYLVNLLYCVEGACTDPPRWNNCSMSSTSSSSSTSAQTTTSSKWTTSSTDSTTTSTDRETSETTSTPNSTSTTTITTATLETGKGDNNEDTTPKTTTITGSTSETKTTTDVESSSESTNTQLSTDGTTGTGSTGIETTPLTTTTANSGGSTATGETTTSSTSTGTTGNIMTTSESSTTTSTSTVSFTPTTSPISASSGSSDTTETTGTTQTSSTTAVTPTSTTTESSSSATTISGQTAQSTPTTEVTGTTTSHTTSTGTSGASTTSGTTGATPGTTAGNQTTTSTSTTGSTSGTTTNTDGVYFRNTTSEIFSNCTRVTTELIYYINGTGLRNVTYDHSISGCSSTTPMTTPEQTTTYNWPTGGTTRILPSGEIILSESLIAYPNCTTVLKQLIFNPSTNQTRTESSSDINGCKTSTTPLMISTTPMSTPVTTPTQSTTAKTTTFNWPTGGTTRILPSGEIILSESLIAYKNCTTVLMQLIFNPSTNQTRTETTTDEYGCRTSSSTMTSSKFSTTPMTTTTSKSETTKTTSSKTGTTGSTSKKTTTYNWPTGGTTRILPSGEIILSESLIAYKNCTTVLMQLIFNPSTNETRTATTTDEYGCKATSSTSSQSTTTMPSTTTVKSTTPPTTTFPWPTGGTTRTLPNGEIILSESLIAYKNCTTVLMQLIFNPSTNTTRTVSESNKDGCKVTSTTVAQSVKTTTYNWPTGGTTRTLPSGEIILSESLIAYKNCTTVLMQLIYNPSTNKTRTETTSDAEGCKATSSSAYITTPMSGGSTTPSPSDATTTFQWPTGGTTRMLPSGEIIISESLIAYKNCTTVLMQLIFNPSTNKTRTETTTDVNGCKATSTASGITSAMTTPTTTEAPFTFPESKTTQILPNGEILMSESLIAYPNCTTVLKQLIFNPATSTTRTETLSDAQGCKATTTTKPFATTPIPPTTTARSSTTTPVVSRTASPITTTTSLPTSTTSRPRSTTSVAVTCTFPSNLNLINTNRPTPEEIKENYAVGERIIHICKKYYIQELSKQPLRIYQCGEDGKWIGTLQKCVLEPGRKAEL